MEHTRIRLPEGRLTPFGPSPELDRAVIASALHANPTAGEALAMAVAVIQCFRENRAAIEQFAALALDLADAIDGDADFEETGDERDGAYVEWQTMRGSQKRGPCRTMGHEDDEDDDAREEDDPSGQIDEDGINTNQLYAYSDKPGCPIGDPGDISCTEWQTRGRNKLDAGIYRKDGWLAREDDEEDDAPEDDEADDHSFGEDEPVAAYARLDTGPGCPFTDQDIGYDGS